MAKKLYRLDAKIYASLTAEIAKLPKQQQQILRTMATHCVDHGMVGTEIIALAVKAGLETRQDHAVLYAWYARSNEKHGAYIEGKAPTLSMTGTATASLVDDGQMDLFTE